MTEMTLDYETFSRIREELLPYARDNLNLSPNAKKVFGEVYLRSREDGEAETIADRMVAISLDIASAEMKYLPKYMPEEEKIGHVRNDAKRNLELYVTNKFRANTPTNLNMGRWKAKYAPSGDITGYQQSTQLGSACFVIPIEDTFGEDVTDLQDGILEAWITQQLVHKDGGGTGFSFQRLRPKGSVIGYNPSVDGMNSMSWDGRRGVSSGYESFLAHFFNSATEAVKQGNSRRGANMGIQRIDHMDFLDQLFAKYGSERTIKNFNLSLAVTDEFMEAAHEGRTYTLYNPNRARSDIKKVLKEKWGVENPETVRKHDIATKAQFVSIMDKNKKNPLLPLTTPNMYLDDDGKTVINAYTGEAIGSVFDDIVRIDARKVLDIFAKNAHSNGEPGMFNIDRANEYNPVGHSQEKEATNPCGEQPLVPYGSCNLGSINAGEFVKYNIFDSAEEIQGIPEDAWVRRHTRFDGKVGVMWFDWNDLRSTIRTGTRFLDNVIERSDFPSQKIKNAAEEGRNIGLGYMGVHDAMILLNMRYGSTESYEFAERLAKELHDESLVESKKLAEERGEFLLWKGSMHDPDSDLYKWFISMPKTIPDRFKGERKLSDRVDRSRVIAYGTGKVRNECRMTQAPTGTIRRASGSSDHGTGLENLAISSGIEPVFSLVEGSNILNTSLMDFSYATAVVLQRAGLPVKEIAEAIGKNKGSAKIYNYTTPEVATVLKKIPEEIREVLVTAAGGEGDVYEIKPEEHVRMQTVFQKYNDSAISKTINLPSSATPDDVRQSYIDLWLQGAKGGTAYVDQSRKFQILNVVSHDSLEHRASSNGNGKKVKRPLLQWSVTLELPYISSVMKEGVGNIDSSPDSCFTTLTFNKINGHLTGVFQNITDSDTERTTSMTRANRDLSARLKEGKSLDEVIIELEKAGVSGKVGVMTDKAVMNGSRENLRYQVEGSTTSADLLSALYLARFLTDDGKEFGVEQINERMKMYEVGEISLRSIVNTRGKIKIEDGNGKMPSILGGKRVVTVPMGISTKLCPECG